MAGVGLSRQRIVAAALLLIEEHSLATLTMRQLATTLGVEAMSLYRYVAGREALLDAVVDTVIGELWADPEVLGSPRDGWQDFLVRLAHGVRRIATTYPHAFPLVASRPPEAPWIRPPLRSVEWVETFLTALIQEGFTDRDAVDAYRSFTSFLLGNLLLEVASMGAQITPADDPSGVPAGEFPEPGQDQRRRFPTTAGLRELLSQNRAQREFEEALEDLLERIGRRRALEGTDAG